MSVADSASTFFRSTREYQKWGRNTDTAAFVLTVVLTLCVQLPGVLAQVELLVVKRSAHAIEPVTFVMQLIYFLVFGIRAYGRRELGSLINVFVLSPPIIAILAAVISFGDFSRAAAGALIAGLILAAITFASDERRQGYCFGFASLAVFIGLMMQPIKIIQTGAAEVSVLFPLTWMIVCIAWTMYGSAVGNAYITIASSAFAFAYGLMLVAIFIH